MRWRFPKAELLALTIGVVGCVVLLLGIEAALRLLDIGETQYDRSYTPGYFHWTEQGILEPSPGTFQGRMFNRQTKQAVYEVEYAVDSFGRRITPVADTTSAKRAVLFFGDSFTYGEGVRGDETLPYYLGRVAPQYRPFNYGFSGYGPFDVLA